MTPTRQRIFGAGAFGLTAGTQSLGKPPAVYPGAVVTDASMMIAVDRQQTRLALALNATATSMTVADGTIIKAYNLLSIDNEIVKTTGAPSGNVIPISRGFDGTAAAAHAANAVVSGFVDAYHHNTLVAEIEAIEQALGPNLANVGQGIVSAAYNFPAQSPSGALIVGSNVITMTPVPAGVNGTDTGHYLYVQTTGTPEAALIVGGSGTSGQASGQIIIQCANPHPAGWTITSASGGIQEAINAASAGGGATVNVSAGTIMICGTVRVPPNTDLRGAGAASRLVPCTSSMVMFTFSPTGYHRSRVSNLQIDASSFTGINAVKGFYGSGVQQIAFDHIWLNNVRYGFYFTTVCWDVDIRSVFTLDTSGLYFGDDSGVSYSFNLTLDGWYSHNTGAMAAFPMLTLERAVNCHVSHFITQDLHFIATGVRINNDCQGVSIENSTIVAPATGIQTAWDNVNGQAGGGPNWITLTNLMVDQAKVYGVYLVPGSSWNTFTALSIQNLQAGGIGIYNPANSIGNVCTGLNFSGIDSCTGFLADTAARYWSITDSYFYLPTAACTGIKIINGANTFHITDSLFDGVGMPINDASGGVIKIMSRNQNTTPNVLAQTDILNPAENYSLTARTVTVKSAIATAFGSLLLANGANQNVNIEPSGSPTSSYFRIAGPTGAFTVGGFTNGTDGRILRIYNTSGQAMTISNDDPASTAANRIFTGTGANIVLPVGNTFATFIYDVPFARWILTGHQP